MYRSALAALLIAAPFLGTPSFAKPPPAGSEDYEVTAPYGDWFKTLRDAGGALCCTLSDCRPVDARISAEGQWEFLADPKHFEGGDGRWVKVPDEKVLRRHNPVGQPIACYINGFPPFCFLPPEGV